MTETKIGYRAVIHTAEAVAASDGAGVSLKRVIGSPSLRMVDPFLMLDEFGSPEPGRHDAGFPDHPHRGFETVTYMLAGRMRHEDSKGNAGVIGAGGVQWMTAGSGIVHSEMPEPDDGVMWGFQLWVNLPAVKKMTPPGYQEFGPDELAVERRDDGTVVRIVAGRTSAGATGPVSGIPTDPVYFDVELPPGGVFEESVAADATVLTYVFVGAASVADGSGGASDLLAAGTAAVLGEGDKVRIEAGPDGARLLLLAGRPLNEPVAWGGPFVMNTREEVMQAYEDYQSGRLA